MSLYREARSGRRRLWLAAAGAAGLVAVAAGVVLARGGEPSEAERLESLQDDVRPALDALELVAITYRSPEAPMRAGAASQLEVARTTVTDNLERLRALDPAATTDLVEDLDALSTLLRTSAPLAEVERAAGEASGRLRSVVGLD